MTRTAIYSLQDNTLTEQPAIEKPGLPPDQSKYDSLQEWKEDTWTWSLKHSEYTKAVAECRTIPCHESARSLWKDGQRLEENKDYRLTKNCGVPGGCFFEAACVTCDLIAFPLSVKSEQGDDDLWFEMLDTIFDLTVERKHKEVVDKIAELKSKYIITKR